MRVYTETPQLQTQDLLNVVVLSHVLAQPSRVAAAMASATSTVRLLTVLDARSFLDEWESPEELPSALREAAKTDARAHMRDKKKASEVLAECVENADVIALSHADAGDGDELEMLEAMLRELNPSAAIVRRAGEGGGKILKHVRASPECPAPNGRSGCWQAILAARKQGTGEEGGAEDEEKQEGEEEEDGESDCESDARVTSTTSTTRAMGKTRATMATTAMRATSTTSMTRSRSSGSRMARARRWRRPTKTGSRR